MQPVIVTAEQQNDPAFVDPVKIQITKTGKDNFTEPEIDEMGKKLAILLSVEVCYGKVRKTYVRRSWGEYICYQVKRWRP